MGGKVARALCGGHVPKTSAAREALGVKAGDQLLVVVRGEKVIIIEKPKSYRKAIRGMGKGLYPDGYLAKERKGWD
jgi:bifunctional DNA-binding transcriptional regulator/antitoxin component of YhaV-PrlF toxin-antitoxin module